MDDRTALLNRPHGSGASNGSDLRRHSSVHSLHKGDYYDGSLYGEVRQPTSSVDWWWGNGSDLPRGLPRGRWSLRVTPSWGRSNKACRPLRHLVTHVTSPSGPRSAPWRRVHACPASPLLSEAAASCRRPHGPQTRRSGEQPRRTTEGGAWWSCRSSATCWPTPSRGRPGLCPRALRCPCSPGAPGGHRRGHAQAVHLRLRGVRARAELPADVRTAGRVLVSGRLLADISRSLPARPVTLTTRARRSSSRAARAASRC